MKTFQALGALLSYPEPDLVAALPEIGQVLDQERLLAREPRQRLDDLFARLASTDLYELQEDYVALFDRGRATSLNLFEHVHGESRERGQAMVELMEMYRAGGLRLASHELPDYLPAFLEFASLQPLGEARDLLGEMAHILREIGNQLARKGSPYYASLAALLAIAEEPGLSEAYVPRGARQAVPAREELAAMDKAWLDEPVTFGGPEAKEAVVKFYDKGAAR
jgi:nitrate reductase delta subunit